MNKRERNHSIEFLKSLVNKRSADLPIVPPPSEEPELTPEEDVALRKKIQEEAEVAAPIPAPYSGPPRNEPVTEQEPKEETPKQQFPPLDSKWISVIMLAKKNSPASQEARDKAWEMIMQKFGGIINHWINRTTHYKGASALKDLLFVEGIKQLQYSIDTWDPNHPSSKSFPQWAYWQVGQKIKELTYLYGSGRVMPRDKKINKVSLDAPVGEEGEGTLLDTINIQKSQPTDKTKIGQQVFELLVQLFNENYLADTELYILLKLFGLGGEQQMTGVQVAKELGMSSSWVTRQLQDRIYPKLADIPALYKLFKQMLAADPGSDIGTATPLGSEENSEVEPFLGGNPSE